MNEKEVTLLEILEAPECSKVRVDNMELLETILQRYKKDAPEDKVKIKQIESYLNKKYDPFNYIIYALSGFMHTSEYKELLFKSKWCMKIN